MLKREGTAFQPCHYMNPQSFAAQPLDEASILETN
jgi:hypothetical protein